MPLSDSDVGTQDVLRRSGGDRAAIAKVFVAIPRKISISLVARTSRRVREVESYALSKFQPPTTLGASQNFEKTVSEKIDFLGFWKSVFLHFSWILKGIAFFRRQNQFPREILLQIHLF